MKRYNTTQDDGEPGQLTVSQALVADETACVNLQVGLPGRSWLECADVGDAFWCGRQAQSLLYGFVC